MVTFSGGPFGGDVHDGAGWPDGETRNFEGALYRREGDQAVYTGQAE